MTHDRLRAQRSPGEIINAITRTNEFLKEASTLDRRKAGKFLKNSNIKDTTILFKGSQGGIYLEDAVKELLLDPSDAEKLVRQSQSWKQIKAKFYDSFSQSQK
jgi:hypothetical protein